MCPLPPQGFGGNAGLDTYWNIATISKTSDQIISTITFTDIGQFNESLPQGVYQFELKLVAEPSDVTGDVTVRMQTTGTIAEAVWGKEGVDIKQDTISLAQNYDFTTASTALLILEGTVEFTQAAGGTLRVQVAQQVASGSLTIREGSTFAIRE